MLSAAPTILALETDSAWVVILSVSFVTLVAALVARRLLTRPGGLASGVLLALPLALPLLAAVVYQQALLPDVAVWRPVGSTLLQSGQDLLHLLRLSDGRTSTFYALNGSAGPAIVFIGLGISSFMLARRASGTLLMRRVVRRCTELEPDERWIAQIASDLSRRAGMLAPRVLVLPPEVSGAFALGARRGRILLSRDVIEKLDPAELRGVLAHEIAHLQARDVPVVFLAGVLRDCVAWNPFAHIAFRRLARDREFEADRRAAALTEDPLSLASGLLVMFEMMRGRTGVSQKAALAFLRPGGQVSSRVNHLIAVADGRTEVAPLGSIPFLVAGLLIATLGLQVGERVAQDGDALAIVWGAPASTSGEVWEAPKQLRKRYTALRAVHALDVPKGKPGSWKRPLRYPELRGGVRVKDADIATWLRAVEDRMTSAGLSQATSAWEARQDWQAVPLLHADQGVPIGIYRLNHLL